MGKTRAQGGKSRAPHEIGSYPGPQSRRTARARSRDQRAPAARTALRSGPRGRSLLRLHPQQSVLIEITPPTDILTCEERIKMRCI